MLIQCLICYIFYPWRTPLWIFISSDVYLLFLILLSGHSIGVKLFLYLWGLSFSFLMFRWVGHVLFYQKLYCSLYKIRADLNSYLGIFVTEHWVRTALSFPAFKLCVADIYIKLPEYSIMDQSFQDLQFVWHKAYRTIFKTMLGIFLL